MRHAVQSVVHAIAARYAHVHANTRIVLREGVIWHVGTGWHAFLGVVACKGTIWTLCYALVGRVVGVGNQSIGTG